MEAGLVILIILVIVAVKVVFPLYLLLKEPEAYQRLKAQEAEEGAKRREMMGKAAMGGLKVASLFFKR